MILAKSVFPGRYRNKQGKNAGISNRCIPEPELATVFDKMKG
jgi:hypothetical protein